MTIKKIAGVSLALVLAVGAAALGYQQWQQQEAGNNGFYRSNGRIEARQSHVASRLPGTLSKVLVREGDHVSVGQSLAVLDNRPLQADITKAEAGIQQARDQLQLSQAQLAQHESECEYARNSLARIQSLSRKQYVSVDQLDSTTMRAESCASVINAAKAAVAASESALKVAEAARARLQVDLEDSTISAPFSGYILYRLVEPGEVITPNGRLFTLVSDSDVYITVFLPAEVAGKLANGDESRLFLDAKPDMAIPARVSFIAAEAQFTPKTVETASERSKLMFRAKLDVDPVFLQQNSWVKSGMPGLAVLRTAAERPWPASGK